LTFASSLSQITLSGFHTWAQSELEAKPGEIRPQRSSHEEDAGGREVPPARFGASEREPQAE
jgi:hypothetical protein